MSRSSHKNERVQAGRLATVLPLTLALLSGCGSSSHVAANEASPTAKATASQSASPSASAPSSAGAPYGADQIAWPTTGSALDELLRRMPASIGGLARTSAGASPEGGGVQYGTGEPEFDSPRPTPVVKVVVQTEASAKSMGLEEELKGQPASLLLMTFGLGYGAKEGTWIGNLPTPDSYTPQPGFTWFEATVSTVEGPGTLKPSQYRYMGGWAGPGMVSFFIDAPTPQLRSQVARALVEAAQ